MQTKDSIVKNILKYNWIENNIFLAHVFLYSNIIYFKLRISSTFFQTFNIYLAFLEKNATEKTNSHFQIKNFNHFYALCSSSFDRHIIVFLINETRELN